MKREVRIEGRSIWIEAVRNGDAVTFTATGGDGARTASIVEAEPGVYSVLLEGKSYMVRLARGKKELLVSLCGREYIVDIIDPRARSRGPGALGGDGRQVLSAPMPGKIIKRLVGEGAQVEAGQGIIVVEAMKMQNEMKAARSGKVISLPAAEGDTVTAGDILAIIE